jgi:hypothetical protein
MPFGSRLDDSVLHLLGFSKTEGETFSFGPLLGRQHLEE